MTRLIGQMGGEGIHLSVPSNGSWPSLDLDCDAAVVMVRDWWVATASRARARHRSPWGMRDDPFGCYSRAYTEIVTQLRVPWRMVVFESLVARPEAVLENVAEWLELDASGVTETIYDANLQWHE